MVTPPVVVAASSSKCGWISLSLRLQGAQSVYPALGRCNFLCWEHCNWAKDICKVSQSKVLFWSRLLICSFVCWIFFVLEVTCNTEVVAALCLKIEHPPSNYVRHAVWAVFGSWLVVTLLAAMVFVPNECPSQTANVHVDELCYDLLWHLVGLLGKG